VQCAASTQGSTFWVSLARCVAVSVRSGLAKIVQTRLESDWPNFGFVYKSYFFRDSNGTFIWVQVRTDLYPINRPTADVHNSTHEIVHRLRNYEIYIYVCESCVSFEAILISSLFVCPRSVFQSGANFQVQPPQSSTLSAYPADLCFVS